MSESVSEIGFDSHRPKTSKFLGLRKLFQNIQVLSISTQMFRVELPQLRQRSLKSRVDFEINDFNELSISFVQN